jgi:type IV pilus assembly protein PilA
MKVFLKRKNGQGGFSLVELMIVVAIIGILAALAVPKFQTFQAKARASESKNNLSHAYTLEMSYHGDNDTYASLQNIGFNLNGVAAGATGITAQVANKIRYSYTHPTVAQNGFVIQASAAVGALGSCQTAAHVVRINENKVVGSAVNANTNTGANNAPISGC